MRRLAALCLLLAAACSTRTDSDQLSLARHRLRPAGCEATPAVAAVAGVNADPHQLFLGDWIVVSVCHLDQLLKAADAAQAPITLFIEGKDTGNEPVGVDVESGTLTFVLDRNASNRELWRPYLYDPLFEPQTSLRVSVGVHGDRPLPRAPHANLTIQVRKIYVDWTTWLWVLLLTAIAVALIAAATRTAMLREGRHYSLARAQMAWWFFVIVVSYTFIWIVTGDRDTIPPSVLGLMGISSATAVVAAALPKREEEAAAESRGWRDLVSDENGIALDRLQVVVWTVILSGVFVTSVVWDLSMPEFNTTLLALMGISAGTYVGFKLPPRS